MDQNGEPAEDCRRYEFDDVVVDRDAYRLLKSGQTKALGPRAFDLLLDLLRHPGRVVEKHELIERVWRGVAVTDNAVTRAMKELRGAIGDDASAPRYIETVARRGYRFLADVRRSTRPGRRMLAVLPFSDFSENPEAYFCDGLTEELIGRIAQLDADRLGVIARTSSMAYKGTRKSAFDIARELGVSHLLEGSVRREGSRVRISAQLIDAQTQDHAWAGSYDENLTDVLQMQQRVAEAVADAIQVGLSPARSRRQAPALDPAAYVAYLEGRYLWTQRTAAGIRGAINAFQQAISLAPGFAPAHVALARCYLAFALGLLPRGEAEPLAHAAVRRGLELDEQLAEGYATLGALEGSAGNAAAAEGAFRHALLLDPNDAAAHHWHAMFHLVGTGRFDEALEELHRARILDPLALVVAADVAVVLYLMRATDEALAQCRRVLDLNPHFGRAHLYTGWVLAARDEHEKAVAEFEIAARLDATPLSAGWLGYGYGRTGRRSEAERALGELRRFSQHGIEVAFFEALVRMGLGETERTIEALERGRAEQSVGFGVVRFMPAFDPLQHHPRFRQIVDRSAPINTPRARRP